MGFANLLKFKISGEVGHKDISKEIMDYPEARTTLSVEKVSRIALGSSIQGNLTSNDNFYFNGRMVGEIRLNNKLVLGEDADITGNIYALNVIVLGKVEGQIFVKEKATFGHSSSFKGTILTKILEVESGAIFNAECQMDYSEGIREDIAGSLPIKTKSVAVQDVNTRVEDIPTHIHVSSHTEIDSEGTDVNFFPGIF